MPIFLTSSTLEGELFVVELLKIGPIPHREFYCLWQTSIKIHLDADTGTGVLILWAGHINVLPQGGPYSLEGFRVPAVHRKIGQFDPDWYCFGGVSLRIEIRIPPIKVGPLWPHEIGLVSENEIFVFLGFEVEQEEASSNGV